ncbi:enoyl-CoA hydratase/isomerase family protein [Halopseudomonas bauzanensis]|uniref:Enoyl-CoA hydratase/isomerase family protein n=1 Tax=Halopseudomonas bauzanensis TaxID=653930 RepID=A0A4U0YMT6_9GAMM|nr:enoyl-CoA hydratase/isomerase family protein [Halopseudomonas bauzanensis]TKA92668.1 enoyl-CoA hydratase/isomerase family protein [Halopseudomonas bauzanensis]
MTEHSPLQVRSENGITWIQLNRPEQRNALDIPTLTALTSLLHDLDADDGTRTVVLTGTGRSFCAGADLAEWAAAEARGELETYGWTQAAHKLMVALYHLNKPTIAAVNGTAVGAGMDLSLCCDFRVAARSARFKAGYTSMGYCPDAGASWHLPRLIGLEQAKLFIFLDELWNADQALAAGMVGRVVDDHQLLSCTTELATRLASGPTLAHGFTKQLMRDGAKRGLAEQLAAEQDAGLVCGRSEDGIEALRAVAEKRSPNFIGR